MGTYFTDFATTDALVAATLNDRLDELDTAIAGRAAAADVLWQNVFFNGGFDLWQRTADDTAVTTTRKYSADRWAVKTGAGTLAHVQRSTTVRTGALSKYAMQLDGAAGVSTVDVDQRIEAALSGLYKRQVVFSCYLYNGSGASFTPKIFVSTPSAADNWGTSTVRNGGGSGENLQACADGAWTRLTWTADISGYTNIDNGLEVRLQIPSGSLVAGDTVRLAEVSLTPGSAATPFLARPVGHEAMLCQRYYRKSYALSTAPGTATIVNQESYQTRTALAGSTAGTAIIQTVQFGQMRTTPTITLYSPVSGAVNAIRVADAGADRTGCTPGGVGETRFGYISATNASATAIVLDYSIQFHWAADAEL